MAHVPSADLDSLGIVVSQLNGAIAEASGVVQDVDRYLAEEFDIGVWAISRPFDSQRGTGEEGRELLISSHLAYGKAAGRSRLHVLTAALERADGSDQFTQIVSEERTPWPLCPREIKLHSFAMLPELLGTLASKAEEIAAQTSRTSETVRQLLETMGRHSHGTLELTSSRRASNQPHTHSPNSEPSEPEPALATQGVGPDLDSGLFRRSRSR